MVRDKSEVAAVLAVKNPGKIFHADCIYEAIGFIETVGTIRMQDIRRSAVERAIYRRGPFDS